MNDSSRARILGNLRSALEKSPLDIPETPDIPIQTISRGERIEKLKTMMEAVRSEVYVVKKADWADILAARLKNRGLKTLLYGPDTPLGWDLEAAWKHNIKGLPELVPYVDKVESFKTELFQYDAGITSTRGAIAETGALALWPDEKEPRLMSLVPPVHIAVVDSNFIFNDFKEIIYTQNWNAEMTTNVLLISGPSKTADIELTLAFGVHGPKELIVLIRD